MPWVQTLWIEVISTLHCQSEACCLIILHTVEALLHVSGSPPDAKKVSVIGAAYENGFCKRPLDV